MKGDDVEELAALRGENFTILFKIFEKHPSPVHKRIPSWALIYL